jgi:hypothetical protein
MCRPMNVPALLVPTAGPEFKAFQKISMGKFFYFTCLEINLDFLGNIFQYKSYLIVWREW